MYIRHYALVVALLLAGCDKDQPQEVSVEQPQRSAAPLETPGLAEPAVQEPIAAGVPVEIVTVEPESPPEKPSLPVDLSLPQELLDGMHPGEPIPDEQTQSLLPPLFVDKPEPERLLQFNGRLLLNEEIKADPRTSIEGAELQLELKR